MGVGTGPTLAEPIIYLTAIELLTLTATGTVP